MKLRKILSFLLAVGMSAGLLAACTAENTGKEAEDIMASLEHLPDFPNVDTAGMTELQKAVVLTAESFVIRKARGQYDDTRLTASGDPAFYRWATGQMSPEDYTSQNIGYSNCAAFARDLYLAALDLDIQYYTTATQTSGCKKVLARAPVAEKFANKSAEELETYKQEFLAALQPGDLIVYRYAEKSNGHAMCYVGNNMMIHCTGSNYNYTDREEKYEENGCFRYDSIDTFWDTESRRYLFNKNSYVLIRPLDDFTGEIPIRTQDRMDVMRGVVAEKTTSATRAQTVNPGQEVTFTFTLQNLTGLEKTLTITDTIPENTTYVSGAEKQDGDAIFWTVILPARETVTVSYTVRVNDDAKTVESRSYVEHVPVNCLAITVGKTLTAQEQETLSAAVANTDTSAGGGVALAAAIYKEAFGTKLLADVTADDMMEEIFRYYSDTAEAAAPYELWPTHWFVRDENGAYDSMIAPGLYGGRSVLEGTEEKPVSKLDFMAIKRTRLVAENQLIPGDIILASDSEIRFQTVAWLYIDGQLLDLQTGEKIAAEPTLSQLLCYQHFAVIRPSLGM